MQASYVSTWEIKSYIELRPDGTGIKRGVASDNGTKVAEKMEALRWSYLGKNRWSVAVVPGSVQHLYGEEWWNEYAADTSVFRFLPPRLYDFTFEISYVPLDDRGLVRTIHQEQRGQQ